MLHEACIFYGRIIISLHKNLAPFHFFRGEEEGGTDPCPPPLDPSLGGREEKILLPSDPAGYE